MEDTIALDVHAINELKEKKFQPTDDSIKYNYQGSIDEVITTMKTITNTHDTYVCITSHFLFFGHVNIREVSNLHSKFTF